ncbi:MAG: phytanoyl-CoA dioxygenase family protein [Capsulimonadales bacterium]|nr:phytanoyl-CoA dioxygenase family protein [Capsulimonadales bacterium]
MAPETLAAALSSLRTDGFVVLNDIVDREHLRQIRERMFADIPQILTRSDAPFNWITGNLQQTAPPFPPYLFRDILVNDPVIQLTRAATGRRMVCDMYSGNTAMPGEQRQPVHFDFGPLWPGQAFDHPPHGFVINIPVVDMSPENGAIELWPKSHLAPIPHGLEGITLTEKMLAEQRSIAAPLQPSARLGSVLIRDSRLWHAGMPNRTETPRPMIALTHWIEWFRANGAVTLPRGTEEYVRHPDLTFRARFTDEPIDHIRHGDAYDFRPEDEGVDVVGEQV